MGILRKTEEEIAWCTGRGRFDFDRKKPLSTAIGSELRTAHPLHKLWTVKHVSTGRVFIVSPQLDLFIPVSRRITNTPKRALSRITVVTVCLNEIDCAQRLTFCGTAIGSTGVPGERLGQGRPGGNIHSILG